MSKNIFYTFAYFPALSISAFIFSALFFSAFSFSAFFFSASSLANTDLTPNHCAPLAQEPHNNRVFTQGFVMDAKNAYESSGHYNQSFLTRYPISQQSSIRDIISKKTTKETAKKTEQASDNTKSSPPLQMQLPKDIFAEGLTLFNDALYLVTWKKGLAFKIDKDTLLPIQQFRFSGEGWGLTHNNELLIMSDGTDQLHYLDPDNFQRVKTLKATLAGEPLKNLNELEFHNGIIWANQWHSDNIYGIDESSGEVTTIIDCSGLKEKGVNHRQKNNEDNVLNGIAYDQEKNSLWVTGKYWHSRFLIAIPQSAAADSK